MRDSIKVMVVDDEPLIRKAIKTELNERNESVPCQMNDDGEVTSRPIEVIDTVPGALPLLSALRDPNKPKPDYLLLDMELQGEPTGGIRVAEKVCRDFRNDNGFPIRIIILSGRFDNPAEALPPEQRQQRMLEIGKVVFDALSHGASAFVSKNAAGGFSIENIVRAIACLERGERYYFNYPVMMTLTELAGNMVERYSILQPDFEVSDVERSVLLYEAAGCTAHEIAFNLDNPCENDKSIQDKQKELSRKMDIPNKSGARVAKAIQYGIITPSEVKFLKR